jgi:mono/diheme cytochrome c family protein
MKRAAILSLLLPVAACQSPAAVEPPRPASSSSGAGLAQQACGGCHAVGRAGTSRNPNAAPFAAIANQEGLTAETLSTWLRGAHNYPREMDFQLNDQQVDLLVAHMLSLRDPNYRRPAD